MNFYLFLKKLEIKKVLCFLLGLLGTLLTPCNGFGQVPTAGQPVPLTLRQIWEMLPVGNKTIALSSLLVSEAQEKISDFKAARLPGIDVSGEYAKLSKLPEYENGLFHAPILHPIANIHYSLGADLYLAIYNGHQLTNQIRSAGEAKAIASEREKLTLGEMKLLAAAYYLDLQRSLFFKRLLRQDISDQEQQLIKIKALQKDGVVLKSDVLRAELKLSKQRLQLISILNDIQISNQKINILTARPDENEIDPMDAFSTDSLKVSSYASYDSEAVENAYQTIIAKKDIHLKKLELAKIQGSLYPSVGLFANYAYSYPQGQFYPYSLSLYGFGSAGIKASYSLSGLYMNKHKIVHALLEVKSAEVTLGKAIDDVRQQVKEAYLRLTETLTSVDVSRLNIIQATENDRIVRNSYFNQTALITDLLDADNLLLQSRFDLEAAQLSAQLKYFQLQQILGLL